MRLVIERCVSSTPLFMLIIKSINFIIIFPSQKKPLLLERSAQCAQLATTRLSFARAREDSICLPPLTQAPSAAGSFESLQTCAAQAASAQASQPLLFYSIPILWLRSAKPAKASVNFNILSF